MCSHCSFASLADRDGCENVGNPPKEKPPPGFTVLPGVEPHGFIQKFLVDDGGYTPGGLYTKKILVRIYAQKAAPGLHEGKNRRFKKISFCICSHKWGFYTKGGIIQEGVIHQALQYSTRYVSPGTHFVIENYRR